MVLSGGSCGSQSRELWFSVEGVVVLSLGSCGSQSREL